MNLKKNPKRIYSSKLSPHLPTPFECMKSSVESQP